MASSPAAPEGLFTCGSRQTLSCDPVIRRGRGRSLGQIRAAGSTELSVCAGMVQATEAAAAQQLRNPVRVKPVSGSRSSMWPSLVLSFLSAIFAWIWYRGRGEGKAREAPASPQTSGLSEPAHPEPGSSQQESPAVSPRTSPARTERQPEERELSDDAIVAQAESPQNVPKTEEKAQDDVRERPETLLTGTPMAAAEDDDLVPQEVCAPPNGFPEAAETLHEEGESEEKLLQASEEEVVRPLAAERGAHKLPHDSSPGGASAQEPAQVEELWRKDGPDGVNGDAAGCQLDNSFVVKEKAVGLSKAKENLNQDLYLEMVNTSDNVSNADQSVKHESARSLCSDAVNSPPGLQDDADLTSGFNECSDERMSDAQKVGAGPECSPTDTSNLILAQEEETAALSNSTDNSSEANIHEIDNLKTRKIATIQPMPQNVNITFKVHYVTESDSQVIAVTGDHEKLGNWESYVPLTSGNGGSWSHLITLPADTSLSWKLVIVENGKIDRWEEGENRFLKTAHEDIDVQLCWGRP